VVIIKSDFIGEVFKNISLLISIGRELKENTFQLAAFTVGENVPVVQTAAARG